MAGHSKFKNIMHRKGAQDAKRAKVFNKIAREITVASKMGGPDPDSNPRLRLAIANGRSASMPKDRIERAIKQGQPGGDDADYTEIRYEGYGPGGVAFIVEALTDNRNRTASEVRTAFTKHGGALAETGAVSFMFDQVGEILLPAEAGDADTIFEAALEAGAENVESDEEEHLVTTAKEDFGSVREAMEQQFGELKKSSLEWKPQNSVEVDAERASTLMKMIDVLEDNDDVQKVSYNFEVDEAVLAELEG